MTVQTPAIPAEGEVRPGPSPAPSAFAAALRACEAVSFDIFDTLFVRLIADPEDVFDLVGQRHRLFGFRASRQAAQTEAFSVMNREGRKEITLAGIYACLPDLGAPAAILMASELAVETAVLRPNPEALALLDAARTAGKRIVLTSDMYLPSSMIAELCARHGVAYDRLFVSCEHEATKRDHGALFDLVASDLGLAPDRILHIGDNPVSDVQRGAERGFRTLLYRPAQDVRAPRGLHPYSSVVEGVARSQAYQPHLSVWRRYGFAYGAPAVYGFLAWLEQRAKSDAVERMLFLARDGYVLNRLWSRGGERRAPSSYFKATRTSLALAAMDAQTFGDDIDFLLSGAGRLQVDDIFARIGVTPPSERVLQDLGLSGTSVYDEDRRDRFADLLHAFRWPILKVAAQCRQGLHAYIHELGLTDGLRVGLVDVGWSGTTQAALSRTLSRFVDLDVHGYYLCLQDSEAVRRRRTSERMAALISGAEDARTAVPLYDNRVAVELFFSAPHASVIGYRTRDDGSVEAVEDPGRGADPRLAQASLEINAGIEDGVGLLETATADLGLVPHFPSLLAPLIRLTTRPTAEEAARLGGLYNFDAWGSSAGWRSYMAVPSDRGALVRGDAWPAGLAALVGSRDKRPSRPASEPSPGPSGAGRLASADPNLATS